MINDVSIPLILLGTNANILKIYELCIECGFTVAGIIDDDFYGQGQFCTIPVIDNEQNIANYVNRYQFICVTNWIPDSNPIYIRNRAKRDRQLALLESTNAILATVVSPLAQVSRYSTIGNGVVIDAFSVVEPGIIIADHVTIYANSYVGHGSRVGKNTVIQRHCFITSNVTIGNDVYFGLCSKVCRSHVTIENNTFIHPGLMLLRGTDINEEVSLVGKDLRKIYHNVVVE